MQTQMLSSRGIRPCLMSFMATASVVPPAGSDEFDGGLHVVFGAGEKDGHDADLVLHTGLADVETDIGKLPAHLPDDRLLDLRARGEGEPAAAGVGVGHGSSLRGWLFGCKWPPPNADSVKAMHWPKKLSKHRLIERDAELRGP